MGADRPSIGIRRDGWHRLAPGPGPRSVVGRDEDLVVWDAGRQVVVFPSACPHRGAHLADGVVEDGCLVCPMHGWRWRPDGTNAGTGDGPALPDAVAWPAPTHAGVDGTLVWLSSASPDVPSHDPVDLATLLPAAAEVDEVAEVSWSFALDGLDPAVIIGNAFDGSHLPFVHGRRREVAGLDLTEHLASIEHVDERGGRTRFTAYRSAQLVVDVAVDREDLALGVLFTVDVGPTASATVRYRGAGPGAEALTDRFARLHRRELEADLALFRRQRPERGRHWGPGDGPLRDYEAWVAALA
jgi:phenylpropionate dioxygenase-like ring-hydroxylating dioxygenase large terminal subunit